jgi:hypothetical protein
VEKPIPWPAVASLKWYGSGLHRFHLISDLLQPITPLPLRTRAATHGTFLGPAKVIFIVLRRLVSTE